MSTLSVVVFGGFFGGGVEGKWASVCGEEEEIIEAFSFFKHQFRVGVTRGEPERNSAVPITAVTPAEVPHTLAGGCPTIISGLMQPCASSSFFKSFFLMIREASQFFFFPLNFFYWLLLLTPVKPWRRSWVRVKSRELQMFLLFLQTEQTQDIMFYLCASCRKLDTNCWRTRTGASWATQPPMKWRRFPTTSKQPATYFFIIHPAVNQN